MQTSEVFIYLIPIIFLILFEGYPNKHFKLYYTPWQQSSPKRKSLIIESQNYDIVSCFVKVDILRPLDIF